VDVCLPLTLSICFDSFDPSTIHLSIALEFRTNRIGLFVLFVFMREKKRGGRKEVGLLLVLVLNMNLFMSVVVVVVVF